MALFQRILNQYRDSFSGLSRQTWLLSIVMLVNRAGTMAIPFLGIYATQSMGRSLADAGLLITLFGVGSIVGAWLGGRLTDTFGFRMVQIVTATTSGLLFFVVPFITSFSYLCVHVVVLAIVADALRPANQTAIAAYALPGTLTRSYSLNRLAINLGWAVGGTLGGLLAAIDYHLLFWVDGGTNIAAGLLVLLLLGRRKTAEKAAAPTTPKQSILKDTWVLQFLFVIMLFNTAFFLLFRLVPVFWKEEWQLSERQIGMLLGLNGIIIALVEMVLVNRWERRGRPFRYIMLGALVTAMAYGVLMIPSGGMVLVLSLMAVVLLTIGEMLAMPFMNSTVMQRAEASNRGTYASSYTITWSIAQVIGPAGGAWLAERWGYQWLWVLLMVILGLSALGIRFLQKTYKPAPQS